MFQGTEVRWHEGNALLLDVVQPLDYIDPSDVETMDAANIIDGYLFEKLVDLRVTEDAAAAQSVIKLADTSKLLAADTITVRYSTGDLAVLTIDTVDDATTITVVGTLDDPVREGTFIRKNLEGSFPQSGTAYGTPTLSSTDWGYVVEFSEATVPDLELGQLIEGLVRIEKTATGAIYSQSWDIIRDSAKGTT